MPQTILIVEDEAEIARFIQQLLAKEGFTCLHSRDGEDAVRQCQTHRPNLVILDWMLPGWDGLEVCTRIRKQGGIYDPYILMLTAKAEDFNRVIGLSTGADDYLVKPFSPMELVARVRALLRRSLRQEDRSQTYRTRHFTIDLDRHIATRQVSGAAQELELTTIEFDLLATFLSHPGRAWSRTHLVEKLWGDDFFGEERVVDNHVARLRKKIETDPAHPQFVQTVVGIGYKFEDGEP
ncbi:MAG: response regulator transcription factor [Tildeniella torsiva UHER 1998/13D]|jgi:two-component system OmpR family response regulator|nr:response regulator transcription factor [Tildeniella torsiva UHER 1998/13D]